MAKEDTLRNFVVDQIDRLKSFADFNLHISAEGQKEIRNWIEARCDPGVPQNVISTNLHRSRIRGLIDELLTFESTPDLPIIRKVWRRLYASETERAVAERDCPDCFGSGWMTVRVGVYEGAAHCRCGGSPPRPIYDSSDEKPKGMRASA